MSTVYFVSGLGAYTPIFDRLDLNASHQRYIDYHVPSDDESLAAYAKQLSAQIENPSETVLVGVSLGGLMSIEIAKHVPVKQLIMISSFKQRAEVPGFVRRIGASPIYKAIPAKFQKRPTFWSRRMFGVETAEDWQLLKNIFSNPEDQFLKWSVRQMAMWQNQSVPADYLQIHGTHDRVVSLPKTGNLETIEGGSHLMVYQRAEEVSKLINERL